MAMVVCLTNPWVPDYLSKRDLDFIVKCRRRFLGYLWVDPHRGGWLSLNGLARAMPKLLRPAAPLAYEDRDVGGKG
jgi:hypothetical protein